MSFGRPFLILSLLLLAAASLPGKLAGRPLEVDPMAPRPVELAAIDRLAGLGWTIVGTLALTGNGAYRVHGFESKACPGGLLLTEVRPNGEADAMLAGMAGPGGRLFFIQGGLVYRDLPHFRATLEAKLAPLLQRLGLLPGDVSHEVLAVIVTEDCRDAPVPW